MKFAWPFLFLGAAHAVVNVYMPTVDPNALAASYDVPLACVEALNTTLNCDPVAFAAAAQVDLYEWTSHNLTTLCTAECANSVTAWLSIVESGCAGHTIPVGGMRVEAKYLPLTFKEGYNLACLKSSSNNWCMIESYSWEGRDVTRYPEDYCGSGDPAFDPPECADPKFRAEFQYDIGDRIVDIYPASLVCSDCFLKTWKHRLESAFTYTGNGWADYLKAQFDDMQPACETSIPYTIASKTIVKGTNTLPPSASSTTSLPPTTTCAGTLLQPPASGQRPSCRNLAEQYKVPTGYLVALTASDDCSFDRPICLPPPCDIEMVFAVDTCETLRQRWSTPEKNITATLFASWNRFLLGRCDRLVAAQYLCKGPPGGMYQLPPPAHAPSETSDYTTTATPPVPTATGTIPNCGKYYTVKTGDVCQTICLANGITFAQFREFNPQIDASCSNLWLSYAYCVAKVTGGPVSTDGTCGPQHNNAVCGGSGFGKCCSKHGSCGSTSDFCGAGNCHSGECAAGNDQATQDGTCGPMFHDWQCINPSFGPCCSTSGYCGSTPAYCGPGNCHSGACDPDEGGISVDGSCGPQFAGNKTCTGSQFGKCCSKSGYCGDSSAYCGVGVCHSGACETY